MPPTAEADSVTVASAPVAPLPTPNVEPIADSVSVRMIRSKASSDVARERGLERLLALAAERGPPALGLALHRLDRVPAGRGSGAIRCIEAHA